MKKKAILLTYTFPPLSTGGTPVVLNMCRYLPEYQWEIIPVTVKDPRGMGLDDTLLQEVPDNTRVIRVPHGKNTGTGKTSPDTERGFFGKALGYLAHNYVLVPDRLITWKARVMPVLEDLIRRERPHCIISFGPHHSLHLIARAACRKTGLPHIPYFGDLWLADSYVEWPSRINRFIEGLQERAVVHSARGVIATTEGSAGYFVNRYGHRCPPTHVAENAYDPRRFPEPAPPAGRGEHLIAGWTGNFFARQSPDELLRGLKMFYGRNPDSLLRFKMAGGIDGISLRSLEKAPLAGKVTHEGRLPWKDVPGFQRSCDILVTCLNPRRGSELKNSSKTAEYLISGRAVLAIAPEGDMTERIRDYGRGYTLEPRADEIALGLENIEYQWKTSSLSLPADFRSIEEKFSAIRVMKRLAAFLNEMAAP